MTKYTKPRIMTPSEAEQECQAMGLSPAVTRFIVDQFREHQDAPDNPRNYHGPYVAEDGKIGWAQSWQDVAEDLAVAMGKPAEVGLYGEDPEFEVVWNKFFTE